MALRILQGMMGLLLLAQASVANAVLDIEIIDSYSPGGKGNDGSTFDYFNIQYSAR